MSQINNYWAKVTDPNAEFESPLGINFKFNENSEDSHNVEEKQVFQ